MLQQTKGAHWGPDLDTTTSWDLFQTTCIVHNVAKAWKRAQQERARGIIVRIYGAGKKTISKRYGPMACMPEGLRCEFSFQVVRRGNGYVALTRGPLRWSVDRSLPSRDPNRGRFLVGGMHYTHTLTEANRLARQIHIETGCFVGIEDTDR